MGEGLENRFPCHGEVAKYIRNWTNKKTALFAEKQYVSNTISCVKNTRKIDVFDLNENLGKKGFIISNELEKIEDKTFRIGHMGGTTILDLEKLLLQYL